ncbi:MAG: hypothetical protein ACM3PF_13955 [Bacteroidota bacterium]
MRNRLQLIVSVLALLIAAPASAQYMYFDVNGDGVNTTADVLSSSVTSVDVYVITDQSLSNPSDINSSLVAATCAQGPLDLSINSYNLIISAPSGGVTYGTWTDNMSFPTDTGSGTAGNDAFVGRGSSTFIAAGTHKLGTYTITVTGNPILTLRTPTGGDPVTALTAFGSNCTGVNFDNTLYLGQDWFSVGPTRAPTPVTETTWGKIKALYK